MGQWQVWGSSKSPLLEGSEEDVRQYILDNADKADGEGWYIMDPDGNEFEYDSVNERWRTVQ
jgi:hypothetical protein